MTTPEAAADRDRVGPYQLIKAIGAGGSARIDLARIDRAYGFQRHVVIKRPLEHLRGDPKAAASLRREARIGGRLRHPNLVAILDAGVHDGYDYLVLEYVHGGSLRTLLEADTPSRVRDVPPGVALALVGDVARALHAAHELADDAGSPLGLVHRDVSPGNILIGLDGAAKLADFGIAKETRVQTLSGSMHGTVTYMAPEQCRGHAFDRRADVFSLGVILYELLTGTRLFWADNDVASLHRVLSGNVPSPRKVKPQLSRQLEEVVMTAVAHDQDRRFATARDLADALELYAAEASELLAARSIARWVHDLLGPRDVPWIGAATVVMPAVAPPTDAGREGSLVDIIEAVPAEPEPPLPTFGPTAPGFADEIDTEPRRPPRRARGKRLGILIAIGLAGGAGATAFVMARSHETRRVEQPEPVASGAPAPAPTAVPAPSPEIAPATDAAPPDESRATTSDPPDPPTRRSHGKHRRDATATPPMPETPATPDAGMAAVVEPATQPTGSAGSAGSASHVTPPTRSKVEWNPTMLLPTDSGSGTKKK